MLVLTYHSISDGPPPSCVRPRRFAEQLDFLLAAGWKAIGLQELVGRIEAGDASEPATFAITFDDGYADFLSDALPVLEKRALPATLFAVSAADRDQLDQRDQLDLDQLAGGAGGRLLRRDELAEVARRGVEIGAHTVSHRRLTALDDATLDRELAECKCTLEAIGGARISSFAYPFGDFDRRVMRAAGVHFRAAVTTQLAAVTASVHPLAIPRLDACYLDSRLLRFLLAQHRPDPYLRSRRWLRRLRGSEPRQTCP